MFDKRNNDLAFQLVDYSLDIQEGEVVRIIAHDFQSKPLVKELVKEITKKKAIASVEFIDHEVQALEYLNSNDKSRDVKAKWELEKSKDMDAYILIKCKSNDYEMSIVPLETTSKISSSLAQAQDVRINQKKWVLVGYPSNFNANASKMACDQYEDFFYDVVLVDYKKMKENAEPLKDLMDKTDKVRIVGNGTDLEFSLKGINSVICCGDMNIPDGEVYSAPVKDSVNGVIQYNTISSTQGTQFENVRLVFKDGKIIEATSAINNDKINTVFNTDEGARYVGEFAIGLNPMINEPVGDILFDEKIYGSFHFTPGQSYKDESYNGNNSAIHWDLVCIQTSAFGGGEIYFDDVLVRKDGDFMIDELKNLNK